MSRLFSPTSFAAGIIAGALLGFVAFENSTSLDPFRSSPNTPAAAEQAGNASGAISVADQPAGGSVSVESVTVPPPGVWVAVREIVGSDLGNVLGAARVSGPQTNVTVSLLRATEPNTRYAVELYRDGGNNAFDLSTDSVYVDTDTGERVVAYFTATE